MKLVIAAFVGLIWVFASPPAAAQTKCLYDMECSNGDVCGPQGLCVAPTAPSDETAVETCGNDRRCRIDRLKRRNRARRTVSTLREEEQAQWELERHQKEEDKARPRHSAPWRFDWQVSRLGPAGLDLGYTFGGRFQPHAGFGFSSLDVYVPSGTDVPGGFSGWHDGWFFHAGASYFLLDGWFSPYVSGAAVVGLGTYQSWDYIDDFTFEFVDSSEPSTQFHAGELGAGIDLQFSFGLHSRLGLAYRPLIFNQARYGPGNYDPVARQGLAAWFKRTVAFDVIWQLGWSI